MHKIKRFICIALDLLMFFARLIEAFENEHVELH